MHRKLLAHVLFAAALAFAATPARASEDAVHFMRNIDVTADSPVHDAVCFLCDINVQGKAEGDIVDFFGNVRLNGEAHHDVVNFFGKVSVADNSSIGGDVVSLFGSVHMGQNVSVGKDVVAIFGTVRAPENLSVGGDHVSISPLLLLLPLLVFALIIFGIVEGIRALRGRQFSHGYPPPPYR